MAENTGSIYYSVDIETKRTLSAQQELDRGFESMQKSMDKTDIAAATLSGGLSKLAGAIAAVVAAGALRDMANLVQSYQEMSERVQMATSSQAEFEMVQKRLLDTANATYRSLGEAQELYIRTADSLRSLGYTTSQALDVTDSMSLAFVKNATSADRAGAAISALSKSVNTGKVAADQWETITSAIPSVIDDIARASNKTSAEIRALGAAGTLTATQLTEGLRQSLDENAAAAAAMSNNLRDASVRAETALTAVLVSIENQTGGLQKLTDGIIQAADAVLEFGQDADKMAAFLSAATTAATAFAAVIAGRLIQATGAYVLAQVQAVKGTMAQISADQAAASGALRKAAAEKASALAALEVARAEFNAAQGSNAHAFAANNLIAAQTRAAAAAGAYAAAQTAANRVASAGAIVMGTLGRAMTFLGGPVGVILLAATALYTFAGGAKEAKPPVDALAGSVNELGDANLRLTKIKASEELDRLAKEAEGFKRNIDGAVALMERQASLAEDQRFIKRLTEERAALETNTAEAGKYAARIAEIDKELAKREAGGKPTETGSGGAPALTNPTAPGSSDAEKEAARASKAVAQQVSDLQLQADTLGMTASELEIYKLQLAGATDEQIRAAQSSLALIDAYKQQEDAEAALNKRRAEFGATPTDITKTITGQVDPLSGGAFDTQTSRYEAEAEAERIRYAEQLQRLKDAKALQLEVVGGYNQLEEQLAQQHSDRLSQIEKARQSVMLQTASSTFDSLSGLAAQFAGEQSSIYKVMFAASKAFALADAAVKIQAGIASAAAIPFPANIAAIGTVIAATSSILSTISGTNMAVGRQLGGPVQANQMYRVNETGAPEIFNAANGRQYMMPNQRGEVVSNKNATGGGGGSNVVINIQNNTGAQVRTNETQIDDQRVIDIVVGDMMSDGKIGQATNRITGTPRAGQ